MYGRGDDDDDDDDDEEEEEDESGSANPARALGGQVGLDFLRLLRWKKRRNLPTSSALTPCKVLTGFCQNGQLRLPGDPDQGAERCGHNLSPNSPELSIVESL